MNEQQALAKMISPGVFRPGKLGNLGGVIQILVTSSCDKACYNCTQASQLRRPMSMMTPDQFRQAVLSLQGYFGVVGVFGGNPALSRYFVDYCQIMRELVPYEKRGLWCNNPITETNAKEMRATYNPGVCNLNVHMDRNAWDMFKTHWPECRPFGLDKDSRHSPPWVAMKDVLRRYCNNCQGEGVMWDGYKYNKDITCPVCNGTKQAYDEDKAWELISGCDINQHWSAGIGLFRGQLRGWFCEIAMAQSILHQDEPDYPDTGITIPDIIFEERPTGGYQRRAWWELPMSSFQGQVRKHCHDCGVPLRGYGELAQASDQVGKEQVSSTHKDVYKPKRTGRTVEAITDVVQLGVGRIQRATDYMGNTNR